MLQAGDPAPDFTMEADKGGSVSLADLRGKTVVLYFYPKDDTPGCTRESCAFRDHYPTFQNQDVLIYGVSCDSIPSHEKFSAKFDLPFPLLSDPDTSVSTAYGVYKEKTNYGRKYMGIERSTFVIDGEGRISRIYRNVKVDGHVEKVLDEVSG
ncbi:MAG: thioredoxin-dependent thiol peroxidase [Gemmatimonadetes bacterium]|nr:thioredoxin-dependent thiol peroxidase [Gemmatimonadota bacterium]